MLKTFIKHKDKKNSLNLISNKNDRLFLENLFNFSGNFKDLEKKVNLISISDDVKKEIQNISKIAKFLNLHKDDQTALDKQVDEIMTFDDNAFEAFKRSIANARSVSNVKVASDLGGVNIGVESETPAAKTYSGRMTADTLSSMWE